MRSFIQFSFFLGSVVIGYCLAIQSWGGGVYVYLGEERSPAAVRKMTDYSEVPRQSLHQAAHQQLLQGAEIEKKDGSVGVRLGNPLVRNENGASDFACRVRGREGLYDRVEMTFTGTGISEGGELAQMVIDSPCESAQEVSALSTIWIPMKEITALKAEDGDFDYDAVKIHLLHIPGQWPDNWVLSSVRMFKADDAQPEWKVDAQTLRSSGRELMSFDWK